jgi:tetratricopeptide (TPR) repeat protein
MERRRKMDFAGPASILTVRVRTAIVLALLACCSWSSLAQTSHSILSKAKDLLAKEQWQQLADLAESSKPCSAEMEYLYGTALARLGRWDDARAAFRRGLALAPEDARFPVELAGVEFKRKHYSDAAVLLRHALDISPDDAYANELLGTVYFLQRNLEGALKYWNRVGKPQIANVIPEPPPKTDAVLLDRAFAFSPASLMTVDQLYASRARIHNLGVFSGFGLNLIPRDDTKFDVLFRNEEHNGFGSSKLEVLIMLFRGLPAEEVNPEYFNFHHRATNFEGFYRWDEQKRRWEGSVSGLVRGDPARRYWSGFDLRNENWDLRTAFHGPADQLGSFNLRREAIGANLFSLVGSRWNWSAGAELSHRAFRNIVQGPAITPALLSEGFQLKEITKLDVDVWRFPERRMTLAAAVSSEAGRLWSTPSESFLKTQGMARFHWFPRAEGDDYEIQERVLVGKTFGNEPIDELFILGVLGDNTLEMRGHVTTRQGRKGSGPLGRNYFVSNFDFDKTLFSKWGLTAKAGPFVDIGKITDPTPALGSHDWLYDIGLKIRGSLFGMGAVFIYGKDLRNGNNAFTVELE